MKLRKKDKQKIIEIAVITVIICLTVFTLWYLHEIYYPPYPIYDLYNGKEWDEYRLGDIIKGWLFDNDKQYLDTVPERWPNSIGDQYSRIVGYPRQFKKNDMDALRHVFSNIQYEKPDSETVVVHLRVGDVVDHSRKNEYVRDIPYYSRIKDSFKQHPDIKKVRIFAGAHKDVNHRLSSKLIHEVKNVFSDYDTQIVLTRNPDKDFCYMCHSKYFVKSGGGFSNLIEKYVNTNNGIVFSEDGVGEDYFIPKEES